LTSPIFFSTDEDGKRHKGLHFLPKQDEGPLLFVANHQFGGLDLGMVISQLLEECNLPVRGMAHPVVFQAGNQTGQGGIGDVGGASYDTPLTPSGPISTFQRFGAVMVTPRNYYRLMQTKQAALLFPGGVREVFHGKDEAYQLFWPNSTDFVRTAARFNATIVPLSALGAADSVNIYVDAPDVLKLPFIGERVKEQSRNVVSARFNRENEDELFTPPVAIPTIPARNYFVFGKSMSTVGVDHKDLEACATLYREVKVEVERGFEDVLRVRDNDPFKDTIKRIAYEKATQKKAPTFSMQELNENL